MIGLDERLFFLINGLAGRWPALDWVMTLLVSDYLIPAAMAMVPLAMWFLGKDARQRERNQRSVFCAATGIGFACILVKLVNLGFDRLRPFEAYPDAVNLLFYTCTDPSFPANSTAVGFAFAAGAWFGSRSASGMLLSLAILWSFARIYCGVHYPLDIIGGAAAGIIATVAAFFVLRLVEPLPAWVIRFMRRLYLA